MFIDNKLANVLYIIRKSGSEVIELYRLKMLRRLLIKGLRKANILLLCGFGSHM